ncbi:hypothetical protein OG455_00130 [Kitasatospora sp. NBC_01287]|uniref:hypothetical protein n=1 Tax=Kitasatospora sp. NBC_01287 TaxID=2903573 RepID=UPI002256BD25|nr:hypothetical protein [Kitasatospora sp. NBC_01287]MCX4743935.1 hypothetical protein [Kitasatospora sp. NBC_01287]
MPSQYHLPGSTEDRLLVIDRLSALPFPRVEERPGKESSWGGPGYHLAVLQESQDFWENRSEEIVEAAEQEIETDLATLTAVLTGRWGEPESVDLWPFLGFDNPDPDFVAPEPLGFLCGVAGDMRVWRLRSSGRWVALVIGQADPEWPFQLLAAVGEASSLPE